MKTFSAGTYYGIGGLGSHLAQLVEQARAAGELDRYYARGVRDGDTAGRQVTERLSGKVAQVPPVRFDAGRRAFVAADRFDRSVARRLEPGETFVAFAGHALGSFRRARELGYSRLELVSPTCHVDMVARLNAAAYRSHPLERPWLNETLRNKCLWEYELADVIQITSQYSKASFMEAGVPETKLVSFRLNVDPRFVRRTCEPTGDEFTVVYVGSLTVTKGVAVLVDAFESMPEPRARLRLVGGWGSRGMRKHLERRLARDSRIRVEQLDPLRALESANVYVHPSYQDGFGLAPAEALAVGVRVIVTDQTGMKECIRVGEDGRVVRSGDPYAIREALTIEMRDKYHV